jgi:hypothetical protein
MSIGKLNSAAAVKKVHSAENLFFKCDGAEKGRKVCTFLGPSPTFFFTLRESRSKKGASDWSLALLLMLTLRKNRQQTCGNSFKIKYCLAVDSKV